MKHFDPIGGFLFQQFEMRLYYFWWYDTRPLLSDQGIKLHFFDEVQW